MDYSMFDEKNKRNFVGGIYFWDLVLCDLGLGSVLLNSQR